MVFVEPQSAKLIELGTETSKKRSENNDAVTTIY